MSYMTARVIPAKHVMAGDRVSVCWDTYWDGQATDAALKVVEYVCFDDYYGVSGFWFTPQTEGSYALPRPDVDVEPDELIVVYR